MDISIISTGDEEHRSGWIRQLIAKSTPFLWTGRSTRTSLDFDGLVADYGDCRFRCSNNLHRMDLKDGESNLTLREYVALCAGCDDMDTIPLNRPSPPYLFHNVLIDNSSTAHSNLIADPPSFMKDLSDIDNCIAIRISLGPRGSYVGLHSHGAACNDLLFGAKHWHIYEPRTAQQLESIFGAVIGSPPQLLWMRYFHPLTVQQRGDVSVSLKAVALELQTQGLMNLEKLEEFDWPLMAEDARGIEFDQNPGDTVFIPPRWGHWVLNKEWSFATVYELNFAPKQREYFPKDWDQTYRTKTDAWTTNFPTPTLVGMLSGMALPPSARIVDVGCGSGTDAVFLAKQGYSVTGVDLSAMALDQARRKSVESAVTVKWVRADIRETDAHLLVGNEKSIDLIIDRGCLHSLPLQHWPRYAQFARKLLKPGGRLAVLGCADAENDNFVALTLDRLKSFAPCFSIAFCSESPLVTKENVLSGAFFMLTND